MAIEDTATLKASLKTSLFLDAGTGDPTFSRAGTQDITNSEGGTTTVPENVAAFEGARLVENISLANTGTFNTGDYEVLNLTVTGPNEVTSGAGGTNTIRPAAAAGNFETYTAGRTYSVCYIVESVDVQFVQLITNVGMMGAQRYVNFDALNGTVESNDGSGALTGFISDLGSNQYMLGITFSPVNTATVGNALVLINSATDVFRAPYVVTGDTLNVFGYMVEDITDKTLSQPSEYVSKGVLSAPFHGAGLDGFKWFDTQEDGTPIPDVNLKGLRGGTLSYQTTSNISDTAGAISGLFESDNWASPQGHIGSATTGLHLSSSNSGVQALDGTNTANGPTGTPSGQIKMAVGWSGTDLKAANDALGSVASYDGSLGLSSIEIDVDGTIRDVNIWTVALTDSELIEASGGQAQTDILVNSTIADSLLIGNSSQIINSLVVDSHVAGLSVSPQNSDVTHGIQLNSNIADNGIIGNTSEIEQSIRVDSGIADNSILGIESEIAQGVLVNCPQVNVSLTSISSDISQGVSIDSNVAGISLSGLNSEIILGTGISVNSQVGSANIQGASSNIILPITVNGTVGVMSMNGTPSSIIQSLLMGSNVATINIEATNSSINIPTIVNSDVNSSHISATNAIILMDDVNSLVSNISIDLQLYSPSIELNIKDESINLKL